MGNTELTAVHHLILILAGSNCLDPHISDNDKTPSWDGSIFVYQDKSRNKKSLNAKIPVQVKGTSVEHFHNASRTYGFEVADLKNYYKDGGVVLFVVEVCERAYKIYYKSLYPSRLKKILEKVNKPKAFIELDELNTSRLSILENDCRNFILNREKQFSTIEFPLKLEEAKYLSIHFISDEALVDDYILSHEFPLYGRQYDGEVERFVTNIEFEAIDIQVNREVRTENKGYYTCYEIQKTKGEQIIKLGSKQNIFVNLNTLSFKYKLSGTLDEQVQDVSFLIDLVRSRVFYLGEGRFEITGISDEEIFLNNLNNTLQWLNDVQSLFDFFRIDHNLLDFNLLDNKSSIFLNILIGKFVYNKVYEKVPFQTGFNAVTIGNIYLGILVYKEDEKVGYTIENLFDLNKKEQFYSGRKDGPLFLISPYAALRKDFIVLVDNLDLSIVFEDIKRIEFSKEYHDYVTYFGLELLKAYDETKLESFLTAANDLFIWLQSMKENDHINKINEYQIIRRLRVFSKEEILILRFICEQFEANEDNAPLLCGLSILLENKSDAEYYLSKLQGDVLEGFKDYPIYTLAKNLGVFSQQTS